MPKIKITQDVKHPDPNRMDTAANLILLLPEMDAGAEWPPFLYSDLLKQRLGQRQTKGCAAPFTTDLPNDRGTHVSLACFKAGMSAYERLTLARKLAAPHLAQKPEEVVIYVPGLPPSEARQACEALIAALLAGVDALPSFKSTSSKARKLRNIQLWGLEEKLDTRRLQAEAEGNALARRLTAMPPNHLTPRLYREEVEKLAEKEGWDCEFLDMKALKREKAGAFLAVAQASAEGDAGIVRLRYRPSKKARSAGLALVGKGICYDTGGLNLKSAKHMHGMHEDMAGSAVALGTLLALTRLKVPFPVDCWMALAQNHIGPLAYKQNDVITAADGTTIEVVHTDAEGRMVLADTLALAGREKPGLILDYATLTGACMNALGTRYSGVFSNRESLALEAVEAGRLSGERVWPFPMDEDYDQELDSEVADIKQCTLGGEADHILGARFLGRFVNDIPWLHVDLSAWNNKGGLAQIPTPVTGFGVRFTLSLVLDRSALKKA